MAEFKYRKKRREFKKQTKVRNSDYREIALTKMGKRQLMLTLLSIFGVTLLSIGSTFAMFTVSSKSAEYNVVKSGTLNISFDANSSSTIGLDGALPISDNDGLNQEGNTFTITNTGSLTAEYTVSLQDDNDMITQDNCSDKQLDKGFIKYNIGGTSINLLSDSIDSTIISGSLKAGESKTFTLKLWIKEDATNEALGKHYHGKIVVDAIQEGAPQLATKVVMNKANEEDLDYNTATDDQKKEMWTFSHEATEQTGALTDYRYIGADPNNYVTFNDELWRIIGVFDTDDGTGKMEKRLKIIRNESIGDYVWDANNINDWDTAQLNTTLNTDSYYTSLTAIAKEMIGDTKWYLGRSPSDTDVTATMFYTRERSITTVSGSSTSWTGKVGLMYPSDYGYATSGGNTANRTSCLAKELFRWDKNSDCYNNDWLFLSNSEQWTITSVSASGYVFYVYSDGILKISNAWNTHVARPVVYLKSAIKVTSGSGTKDSPYVLE